jgi:nitrite reductase (NADH) large subunit
MILKQQKTVVVVGNGMVGHRFCERLTQYDENADCRTIVFGEEPRPAYDRVHLTQYFEHRDPRKLQLADETWYEERNILLVLGDRVASIDRENPILRSASGREVLYDVIVLATGSAPFVPPVPGIDKRGVFLYRTTEGGGRPA